jgi:hypothetical protein
MEAELGQFLVDAITAQLMAAMREQPSIEQPVVRGRGQRISREEHDAIRMAITYSPHLSHRKIAKMLNVDHKTVGRIRRQIPT